MPFVMRERKDGKIDVVNPLNGSVKGTHKNKRQAMAQMRALYANVPEALNKRRKQVPDNNQLWMQAKNLAQRRFSVYPSAYANMWAVQWYKEHGGGYKDQTDADIPTESKDPGTMKKSDIKAFLQKFQRQYVLEEWVDITKPIRDAAGLVVGYQTVDSKKDAAYPMKRQMALKLTEDERRDLISGKLGYMPDNDGVPHAPKKEVKKYGRYKRHPSKFGI